MDVVIGYLCLSVSFLLLSIPYLPVHQLNSHLSIFLLGKVCEAVGPEYSL